MTPITDNAENEFGEICTDTACSTKLQENGIFPFLDSSWSPKLHLEISYFSNDTVPMTKQAKLDFCELLANDSLDIVEAFSSQVIIQADRARTQVLCQALSDFFEAQGRSLKLIHWAIQDEVEASKADGSVFRGTSAATLLMNVFFKKVGSEYLRQIISSAVQDICTCNCTFEISPDKCPSEELKANVLKIFSVAQRLLNSIIENIDECPVPIRVSLNVLKRGIAKKFPSLQGVVVGSFLFLRFFCPSIVSPEELNILATPPSQTARRGLILVSKLLQNLANGLEFGNKEPAMASFNPFITDNKDKVEAFFNILADVSVNLPEAVHTHLKSIHAVSQKTRSQSTSGTAEVEVNSKKGKKKRGRSKSMEEQRKKIVSGGSPLASADQVQDGSYDSSINEAIYEDEEDEEDSEDEEHGPTTSDSEPLDLTHRRINAKRGKRFTNALSEDVLSQFINTKLALFQVSVARFEEAFSIIMHCIRQNLDSISDYLLVKDKTETVDKLKEILLILGNTRERSNSAIEERLKEHEKLYVQSQFFMGTASPTQRNLSPVNQKAVKIIKKPSFKKEVKIHGLNKTTDLDKSKSPRDRRDSSPPARKLSFVNPSRESIFSSSTEEKPDKDNRRKSDKRKSSTRPAVSASDSSLLRNELNVLKEEMQRITASNVELQKMNVQLRLKLDRQDEPQMFRAPSNGALNEEIKGMLFEQIRDTMFGDLKTFVVSEIKRYLLSSVKDDIMKMMSTLQSKAMTDMSTMLEQVTKPPSSIPHYGSNTNQSTSASVHETNELNDQVEQMRMTIDKLENELSLQVNVNSQLVKEMKAMRLDAAEEKIKVRTMEQQIVQILKTQEEMQLTQMRLRPNTPPMSPIKSIGTMAFSSPAMPTGNNNVGAVQLMVLAPENDGQTSGSHILKPGQEVPFSANDSAIIITRSRGNSLSVQSGTGPNASSVVIPNSDSSTIIIRSRANSLSIQSANNAPANTNSSTNIAAVTNTNMSIADLPRKNTMHASTPHLYMDVTEEDPESEELLENHRPRAATYDPSYLQGASSSASEPASNQIRSADPAKTTSLGSIVMPQPPSNESLLTASTITPAESRTNSGAEKTPDGSKKRPIPRLSPVGEESSTSGSKKDKKSHRKDKKTGTSSPKKEKKEKKVKEKKEKKPKASSSFVSIKTPKKDKKEK